MGFLEDAIRDGIVPEPTPEEKRLEDAVAEISTTGKHKTQIDGMTVEMGWVDETRKWAPAEEAKARIEREIREFREELGADGRKFRVLFVDERDAIFDGFRESAPSLEDLEEVMKHVRIETEKK